MQKLRIKALRGTKTVFLAPKMYEEHPNLQVFLIKFIFKEAKYLNIIAAILKSTLQSGCVFTLSICLRDFFQIASKKPFIHHSGLWLLLSYIILSKTCSKNPNDNNEDSEVDKC